MSFRLTVSRRCLVFLVLMAALSFLHNLHKSVKLLKSERNDGDFSNKNDGEIPMAEEYKRRLRIREERQQQLRTEEERNSKLPPEQVEPGYEGVIRGAFVHIGKTGGSTLSLLLRNGCHSFLKKPCRSVPNETAASKLVGSYYHIPDFASLPEKHHSFYIITLRDPYDRITSAFAYEHPLNRVSQGHKGKELPMKGSAFRCFPSLEVFVEHIGENVTDFEYPYDANHVITRDCQTLARAVMNSRVRIFNHFFFNFGKILSLLPPRVLINGTIYATRKEYLWQDWKSLNHHLGETREMHLPEGASARNATGLRRPVTRDLSETGRYRLCQALEREYNNYIFLLKAAKNLNQVAVNEALSYSRQNCPNLDLTAHY